MARIVAWDIEATGLKADFAYLLSASFGVVGEEKVTTYTLGDYDSENLFRNEKALVKDVLAEMAKADILISYYGTNYDHPFMNAKALEYNLPFAPPVPKIDLYYTVKSNFAISRKSLANFAYFAQLEATKTPVEGRIWKAAMAGDSKALKNIKDHNEADVDVLIEAYLKVRPLVRQHPRVGQTYAACKFCGGKVISRGPAVTKYKGNQHRFQCKECKSWETRPVA